MSRRLYLQRRDAQTLVLSGLDEFLTGLLGQVPLLGAPAPGSESRLFPSPSLGKDPEADRDWNEWVRPDLEALFASHRETVSVDLKAVRATENGVLELRLPEGHLEAWVHALNQARLSLAAVHHLGEDELSDSVPHSTADALVLFQMQFYGLLQEWFLEAEDSI